MKSLISTTVRPRTKLCGYEIVPEKQEFLKIHLITGYYLMIT
jgi:hypothetical protein